MQQLKMATYFEEILGDMLLKVENMKNNCQHCLNWKGWLAIAKLIPLSLFMSLLLMPNEAFDNVK